MNNAEFGLSLQKRICEKYDLKINNNAQEQFESGYNPFYDEIVEQIIHSIFQEIKYKPVQLLTFTKEIVDGKERPSPHNFALEDGSSLSIRTIKTSDKIAPRIVGQAGFETLNDYFSEIYGKTIESQQDIKELIWNKIHEMLPIFIEHTFLSDYTVIVTEKEAPQISVIKASDVGNYSFERSSFSFTKELGDWHESTTLKYDGDSIAEIQAHKKRTFKFRFIVKAISKWFKNVKVSNETLGISAESAVCKYFGLNEPESFKKRAQEKLVIELTPAIKKSFEIIPKAIKHTGSEPGSRGENSKCSYDFLLENNLTLSLKTNTGRKVCPPEVGQPGAKTCLYYFEELFDQDIDILTGDIFKEMVFSRIDKLIPIYINHLFDSDWLLWIYKDKEGYKHLEINNKDIKKVRWDKNRFTFTKKTVREWNESNTVKYDNTTIGEFQVHKNRSCYKFRFDMPNLINILLDE